MSQTPYQNQGGPGNFPPGGGYTNQPGGPGGFNAPMDRGMVTTGLEFSGYKIVRYLGVVRGLTVRSRSVLGNIGAGFQSLVGGKITIYVELCEHAREEAFNLMMQHASQLGANAIVAMRYDANDVADGITEVLAYGTAVVVQPTQG
jgi:uncharacterized protein YbjQ (UPF0145 family)